MPLWLGPDVHAVMIDGDAVFLDVTANAYFCLPQIGPILTIAGEVLTIAPEAAAARLGEDLCAAGLARPDRPGGLAPPRRRPGPPPSRTARAMLAQAPPRIEPRIRGRHWRALAQAAWTASRQRPFHRLVPPSAPPAPPPGMALMDDLSIFRRLIPWLPLDGACLYRSCLLRTYLVLLGHTVDWVFGVRTWPFRAHCWLQAGDVALDDEAERLIAYHPILVA